MDTSMQVLEIALEVLLVLPPRHPDGDFMAALTCGA
jgi:hypothetical protein